MGKGPGFFQYHGKLWGCHHLDRHAGGPLWIPPLVTTRNDATADLHRSESEGLHVAGAMDHSAIVLNSWNFQATREEIFHPLRGDSSPEERERIRSWMREAVKPSSQIAQLYRVLEIDLDADIVRAAPAFRSTLHYGRYDSRSAFRMFWRVLFRRCAICHARRLCPYLRPTKSLPWRLWRFNGYLIHRLFIGVRYC